MEFRLSENTVNSYDTYKKERDKYKTGANPGGGWVPLKDWYTSNGYTGSTGWADRNVIKRSDGTDDLMLDALNTVLINLGWWFTQDYNKISYWIGAHDVTGGNCGGVRSWLGTLSSYDTDCWDNWAGPAAPIIMVRPL